jgi:aspartate 1-decarboxylase
MGEKSFVAAHASICLTGNGAGAVSRQLSDPIMIMQNATYAAMEIERHHIIVPLRNGMGNASSYQFLPV